MKKCGKLSLNHHQKPSLSIWASAWDYGTYHTGDQRRLRRACESAQSRQSLLCSHRWLIFSLHTQPTWYLLKAKTKVSRIKPRYGTSSVQASSSSVANAEHAASCTRLLASSTRFSNWKKRTGKVCPSATNWNCLNCVMCMYVPMNAHHREIIFPQFLLGQNEIDMWFQFPYLPYFFNPTLKH